MQTALERRLPILQRQFPKLDRFAFEQAAGADPASGLGNLTWILRMLSKDNLRLPEDTAKVRDRLTQFERLKKLPGFQGKRDIGTYRDYAELAQAMDGAMGVRSRREQLGERPETGCDLVLETDEYRVWEITTPEAATWAALGQDQPTEWCTKAPQTSASYLEQGPLYMVEKDGLKFAQVHDPTDQWKDVYDGDLPWDDLHELRELLTPVLGDFHRTEPSVAVNYLIMLEGHFRAPDGDKRKAFRDHFDCVPFEQVIATDVDEAMRYACWPATPRRLPAGEPGILREPAHAARYAVEVLRRPWPEAESVISGDARACVSYAYAFLPSPWEPLGTDKAAETQRGYRQWHIHQAAEGHGGLNETYIEAVLRYAKDMAVASLVVAGVTRKPSETRAAIAFQAAACFLASNRNGNESWERAENMLVHCPLPRAAGFAREYAEVAAGARWPELEARSQTDGKFDAGKAIGCLREWRAAAPFWVCDLDEGGYGVSPYRTSQEKAEFRQAASLRHLAWLPIHHSQPVGLPTGDQPAKFDDYLLTAEEPDERLVSSL